MSKNSATTLAAKVATLEVLDFDELLLNDITIDPRLRSLWTEIYKNATRDRERACILYDDLIIKIHGLQNDSNAHAIHGKTMTTYLERMSKSVDQLLKLAEQVAASKVETDQINTDDLFSEIESK